LKTILLLTPGIFVATLAFGAIDADAALQRQLDRVVSLAEAGKLENVQLTTRQVSLTMKIGGTEVQVEHGVHGARERKQVRLANLRLQLAGDRAAVFESLGRPAYRVREDYAGSVQERWTYVEQHLIYVFEGDRLVRTESF